MSRKDLPASSAVRRVVRCVVDDDDDDEEEEEQTGGGFVTVTSQVNCFRRATLCSHKSVNEHDKTRSRWKLASTLSRFQVSSWDSMKRMWIAVRAS